MSNPKRKRPTPASGDGSQTSNISIHLKSLKTPSQSLRLEFQAPSTSVHELKTQYASRYGLPVEKVKLLHQRKPVADSKMLRELMPEGEQGGEIELSVMVMGGGGGGASSATSAAASAGVEAQERVATSVEAPLPVNEAGEVQGGEGPVVQGNAVLRTEEFWEDLKGFLVQRLRDDEEGRRVAGVFRGAWEKGG